MNRRSWIALVLLLLLATAAVADETGPAPRAFSTLRLSLDTGDTGLAGWQLRADFGKSDARIVGVEGGDAPAWDLPPHYDPRALQGGEIVLAALAAGPAQPRGRSLVAVLHVEHAASGLPPLEVSEVIAVGPEGQPIEATVIQENGEER